MFDDSKRLDALEASVKKLQADMADSQTFDYNWVKSTQEMIKEVKVMIGNAEKVTAALDKTVSDIAARVKTLEGQVAKLGKR